MAHFIEQLLSVTEGQDGAIKRQETITDEEVGLETYSHDGAMELPPLPGGGGGGGGCSGEGEGEGAVIGADAVAEHAVVDSKGVNGVAGGGEGAGESVP